MSVCSNRKRAWRRSKTEKAKQRTGRGLSRGWGKDIFQMALMQGGSLAKTMIGMLCDGDPGPSEPLRRGRRCPARTSSSRVTYRKRAGLVDKVAKQ